MSAVYRLTLMPYLQAWQIGTHSLSVNVILFPTGDPRVSLTDGLGVAGPAIEDADITLTANLSKAVDELPLLTAIDDTLDLSLPMPAGRHDVFQALHDVYGPSAAETPLVRSPANTMRKYLTRSYRDSFAFTRPRTELALTDDSFRCMLKCPPPTPPTKPLPHDASWAEVFANALRVPLAMRRAGLLHTVAITLPAADFYKDGGWLFFTLAGGSDYFDAISQPSFFRTFATRVPPLDIAHPRPVFTPVLFPVFADETAAAAVAARYDEVFPEAISFDDGFAKIVHATQPLGMDHLDEDGSGPPPVADRGVYLGWDDEDILLGQNRHVGLNPDGTEPADAPRGVAGYRIDVRESGATDWSTLSLVHSDHAKIGSLDIGAFDGELRTEVHPRRINDRIWLPAWFASWIGGSMVVDTVDDKLLRNVGTPKTPQFTPVHEDDTPLRYGHHYEFRARMADASGGGPSVGDGAFRGGEAPIARLHFRRRLPPKRLVVKSESTTTAETRIELERPKIDYPAAVFTGIDNAIAKLRAIYDIASAIPFGSPQPEIALPDPDVAFAEIRVLVRPPGFDRENTENGWREVYTTWRSFPAGVGETLTLEGRFVDVAQLADLDLSGQVGAPGTKSGPLVLPTARDVRLELRAAGRSDLTYFADDASRRSAPIATELHAVASAEAALFHTLDPTSELRSVFLRNDANATNAAPATVQAQNDPSTVLVDRLAAAIGAAAIDTTLVAPAGQRAVFGCAGLKHRLSPENGSLTLTHHSELANSWVNAIRVELDRDWTWKGSITPTMTVQRTIRFHPGGPSTTTDVGSLDLLHSISTTALADVPERDRTILFFLDAFTPPPWNNRPYELAVSYRLEVKLEDGEVLTKALETVLPVTTPPKQLPEVVSAGHALSQYAADDDYSATAQRTRMLWLELAKPPDDPRDAYFIRVIAHAPDPLLLACAEPTADPPFEPKSPLDPEPIRVIVPGQADDFAGLATMQKLIPATGSDRHFLVPLPPGVSGNSPELFGFYSYEIRVGHDRGTHDAPFWSTAQGRFGPTLVIEGVQHPAPPLSCASTRVHHALVASAAYAQPFYEGTNILPHPPNTEIWIALYVQVHQTDRASMRNIQLDVRRGTARQEFARSAGKTRELSANVTWSPDELRALLAALGLNERAPLSVLAIELLPEPNGGFQDPLAGDLGDVRILRTSPLVRVQQECC